jgi:hypothetical protein
MPGQNRGERERASACLDRMSPGGRFGGEADTSTQASRPGGSPRTGHSPLNYIRSTASVFWTPTLGIFLPFSAVNAQQHLPDSPKPKVTAAQLKGRSESAWPGTFISGVSTFTIYQPQVEKWEDDVVSLYCAVEVKTGKETAAKYGVVWIRARTEVDKVNRLVTFDEAKVTRVKFPVAADKKPELTALLEKRLPGATRTISLDRLQAALESDNEGVMGVDVKNDPPKVIIATKPSRLVLIDEMPRMSDVPETKLRSVINTRSTILYDGEKQLYFLRVQDGWLQAKEVEGPWAYTVKLSNAMKKAEENVANRNETQDHAGQAAQPQSTLKPKGREVDIPEIPAARCHRTDRNDRDQGPANL